MSSHDLLIIKFSKQGKIIKQSKVLNGVRSEKFLPALAKLIVGNKANLKGIVVAQGAASFTQTRLVCAVANALAYSLSIKLVKVEQGVSLAEIVKKIPKLRWQKLLSPDYKGPAVG